RPRSTRYPPSPSSRTLLGLHRFPRAFELRLRHATDALALRGEVVLHAGESAPELLDRALQRLLGIDGSKARDVYEGKEYVAELVLQPVAIVGLQGRCGFATFFLDFAPSRARIGPIEIHTGRLRRHPLRAEQRWQCARHAVDDGATPPSLLRLALLDGFPLR